MVQPKYCNLPSFIASLSIDYAGDEPPTYLPNINNYKGIGDGLVNNQQLGINNVPGANSYSNWQSWASDAYLQSINDS